MGELVAKGARDLRLEQLRVVPEVARERVAEDHDAVVEVVLGHRVSLVEAVGAAAPAALGDDDGHMLERAVELQRQLVDRGPDKTAEVPLVIGVELVVPLGGGYVKGTLGGQALGPLHDGLEVVDRKSTRLNSSHVEISYAV